MIGKIGLAAALLLTQVQYTRPADTAWQQTAVEDTLSCAPQVMTPPVTMKSERKDPTFTYSESTKDLTQRSLQGGTYRPPGATGPAWHTGGLTQHMFSIENQEPAQVITAANGTHCIKVQSVDLSVVLTPQVWVANDYVPGTCMYNAVHQHEMKHVNVDRAVNDRHLPLIHAAIVKLSQNRGFIGPGSEGEVTAAYNQFSQEINAVIKDQMDAMDAEDTREQQQVDTLQEYERINHLCATQLREMAR